MSHTTRNILIGIIIILLVTGASIWFFARAPLSQDDTAADAPETVQSLILDAAEAAENGTAQEALDAYTKAAEAAEAAGDEAAQATAEANASTYRAIVEAEKQNQEASDDNFTPAELE